jgi:hypothetical protein
MEKTNIFKKYIEEKYKKEYTLISEYKDENTIVKIKHNKCGKIFKVLPFVFLSGVECPKCFKNIKRNNEIFKSEIDKKYKGEYFLLSEYKSDDEKIEVLHKKCGTRFFVFPNILLKEKQCPKCFIKFSKGEEKIKNYLEEKKVNFKPFFKFKNLKFKRNLEFDFAVFNKNGSLKVLIEYDGEQHSKAI